MPEEEEAAESRSDWWWWARRKRTRSIPLLSASTRSAEEEARASDRRCGQSGSARISTRKACAQMSRTVTLKRSVVVVVVVAAVEETQFVLVWRSTPVVERSVRAK